MPYNKTLEEGLKEFDEKFKCIQGDCAGGGHTFPTESEPEGGQCQFCAEYIFPIKSFLISFAEKIREGVVEEIEGMRKELPSKDDDSLYPVEVNGYNQALDDLLAQLKKI